MMNLERKEQKASASEAAIQVDNLARTFCDLQAVDSVSFFLPSGRLFGLLGLNGAGKTTTLDMLYTLLKPTSGRALVAGSDVSRHRDNVRQSISIVFQEPALDGNLASRENLDFHAMMYGLNRDTGRRRIEEVLALVQLNDKTKVLAEKYSGGIKRRLKIARGLVHRPRVMLLDEPTPGLDAQTRRYICDYIKKLNRETGVTIILTTHYMEEADYLYRRIAIMDQG